MHQFRDNQNRTWTVLVTAPDAARVRHQTGRDILDIADESLWSALADRPWELVQVIAVLIEAQLQTAHVTPEDFGRSLTGQQLDDAADALIGALADFFPPRKAAAFRQLHAKSQLMQRVADTASQELLTDERLEALIRARFREAAAKLDALTPGTGSPSTAAGSA